VRGEIVLGLQYVTKQEFAMNLRGVGREVSVLGTKERKGKRRVVSTTWGFTKQPRLKHLFIKEGGSLSLLTKKGEPRNPFRSPRDTGRHAEGTLQSEGREEDTPRKCSQDLRRQKISRANEREKKENFEILLPRGDRGKKTESLSLGNISNKRSIVCQYHKKIRHGKRPGKSDA